MLQLMKTMAMQYPAGEKRQGLLRLIFPDGQWEEKVHHTLTQALHEKAEAGSKPKVSVRS
jgi:hypothetical protein